MANIDLTDVEWEVLKDLVTTEMNAHADDDRGNWDLTAYAGHLTIENLAAKFGKATQ